MTTATKAYRILLLVVVCMSAARGWSLSAGMMPSSNLASLSLSSSKEDQIDAAEFGVSYIGGDPCGSKYNTDPHDAKVTKPGMPDDMKARIAALAEKKIQQAQSNKEEVE